MDLAYDIMRLPARAGVYGFGDHATHTHRTSSQHFRLIRCRYSHVHGTHATVHVN